MNKTTNRIQALNDQFRETFTGGRVVFTSSVAALDSKILDELITAVRYFDNFNEDNDPHGEHDFGAVELNGEKFFWKIDYYDKTMEYGSEDPSYPELTTRVLTIMYANEW